jgi:hypothetical protein
LLGLLLVLIGVAVVGLRPWAPATVIPSVVFSQDPNLGIAESVALPPAGTASVADASVAADKAPELAAAKRVGRPAGTGGAAPQRPETGAVAVVAPAQRVAGPGDGPASPQPQPQVPAAESPAAPVSEPPPVPPAAPVVASVPGSGSRGPIASGGGGPERGCADGEYLIVITPVGEDEGEEPSSQLEIRIEYFGSDGSHDELALQGDEEDVHELVALLGGEGDCVRVEEVPVAEEPAEPVGEELEAEAGAAELDEALESELP